MVPARYIVGAVGALFSIWCVFVAAMTLAGKNVATRHLFSLYPLAYAAIYVVLSPFGLSGVLGALNRKKGLIKGFILQYWFATLLLTAVNCISVYWAHKLSTTTNVQCQSQNQGVSPGDAFKLCNKLIKTSQLASLIFTCVQGGLMIVLGILVIVSGLREAEDIKIDEETSSLLDKAKYEAKPNSDINLTELGDVHRSNNNHSQSNLSRNTTNASSNYNHSNLSRNTTNASSNYNHSNLSRNTTNSSGYGPNRRNQNTYNGLNRNVNNSSVKYGDLRPQPINTTNLGLNRGPFVASNYVPNARNQVPPPGHEDAYMRAPLQAYTKTKKQTVSSHDQFHVDNNYQQYWQPTADLSSYDQFHVDDYQQYWQPTVAKTMAADLTKKGLY